MMEPMDNHERVAQLIRDRLDELGMSKEDLAETSGLSTETLRPLWQGKPTNMRSYNLSKTSVALGWRPRDLQQALADPDHTPTPEGGSNSVSSRLDLARGRLQEIREEAGEKRADVDDALSRLQEKGHPRRQGRGRS